MTGRQLAIVAPALDSGGDGGVTAPWMARIEEHPAWTVVSRLPVMLCVQIPLTRLKVRDLLSLESGMLLQSTWSQTSDVPLSVGEVRLGWSEFEVSGQQIGVRLTQLL